MCKSLQTLPREGGLLDQDHLHVKWLKAGLEAIAEKDRIDNERAKRGSGKSRVR